MAETESEACPISGPTSCPPALGPLWNVTRAGHTLLLIRAAHAVRDPAAGCRRPEARPMLCRGDPKKVGSQVKISFFSMQGSNFDLQQNLNWGFKTLFEICFQSPRPLANSACCVLKNNEALAAEASLSRRQSAPRS